jgi:hypothetical protein
MLVGKAIYNLLSNNANVSALVSTRVYPEVAHQQDVAPYIVYNVRSNEPSDTQLSPSTLDTASVEVNCYAATYETAIAISVAVRGTLDRVQGTYAGVNVQSCQYQSELMNFEEPRRLYVVTADYQVRILRTNVTIPQVMIEAGVYNLDDLSDVNVPAPTDGQALVYDAATSQWVAGDAASAIADLTDVALDEPLDREALVYDEASTSWINGGPAKVDFPVTNNYAGGIALGTVVAFNGEVQGDRPRVVPFSASSANDPNRVVGIASETMAFRTPGHVRSYGTIYGLNTNAYSVGTVLYASTTAGQLTSTPPAAPNHRIALAIVTRQHMNTGRIFVRTYATGYRLGDLSDVSGAAATSNMVLTWDGSKWAPALPTGGYLPGGSPPPGGYTPAIFYRASDATLAVDDDLQWVAGTNTLTTINVTGSGVVKGTNTYGARFATEAATNRALANATGVTVERYFTCTAEGNGESFNIQSNTPSAGNKIVRKIWYKNEAFEATDVDTWTLVHTFADNATYASTATQWAATLEAQTYGKPPFTLAISWEDVPLFTGLLDTYSGAAAAYSVRLLDKDYAGSCIRVRRASDNTEQDIGFDGNGDLDTGALTSFCTGTNGFVKTWYDQSGNAKDATQATTANQPKIYDSSTGVVLKNLLPAIDFDLDLLVVTSSTTTFNNFHNGSNAAFSMVFQPGKIANPNVAYQVFGNNQSSTANRGIEAFWDDRSSLSRNNGTGFTVTSGSTFVSLDITNDKIVANTQNLWFAQFDADNATAALRTQSAVNGSALYGSNASTTSVSASNATYDMQIGSSGSFPSGVPFVGYLQELVFWPSDQSSNRAGIQTNINDYFSIY